MAEPKTTKILYDGECPFCKSYVDFARLRTALGSVDLIDAREHPALVASYLDQGYSIDDGMIVDTGDEIYFGGDAVFAINALLSSNPILNVFSGRSFLKWVYPALRFGRNSVIRLMGRQSILSK